MFVSTGQDALGYNMFAYCNNNPIMYTDSTGCYPLQTAFELLNTWLLDDEEVQCIRRSPAAAGAVVNGSSAVTAAAV